MISLATKYRPKVLKDVVGQYSIVKILNRQIELKEFKNCYLFCGSSGCGKTTCARILANEINGFTGTPIEIDAASNNGVDKIKDLVKSANERSLDAEYKIFIIDEAHALTIQSWQAFLKCIEEPPAFTIFIFCTTEKNKVPDTIKNRCQVFNFNRISSNDIAERLNYICKYEGLNNYYDACNYISKISKGQMRNAISNLEKCISYSTDLTIDNVIQSLGDYSYSNFIELFNVLLDNNQGQLFDILEKTYNSGADLKIFVDEVLDFCIDLLKYNLFQTCDVTKIPSAFEEDVKHLVLFENSSQYYNYYLSKLLELKNMLKNDVTPFSTVQVMFGKMSRLEK